VSDWFFSYEFSKQAAIVDHGLAQVFSAGAPGTAPLGDVVGGPVVGDDAGMLDGQVGGALLEIGHRVAAGGHDLSNQPVGVAYDPRRVVDEARLDALPGASRAFALSRLERADVELRDAFLPGLELGDGAPFVAALRNGMLVLRAEPLAQVLSLPAACGEPDHGADDDQRDDGGDDEVQNCPRIHVRYFS
jgi:hypothetical protein